MIKGINRQMIEVAHTGSPYFERAYFIVRDSAAPPDDATREAEAHAVLTRAESYAGLRRQRAFRRLKRAAAGILCAGGGALVLWICQHLSW